MTTEEWFAKKYYTTETFQKICCAIETDAPYGEKLLEILIEKLNDCVCQCSEQSQTFNATAALRNCKDEITYLLSSEKVPYSAKSHLTSLVFNSLVVTKKKMIVYECCSATIFKGLVNVIFSKLKTFSGTIVCGNDSTYNTTNLSETEELFLSQLSFIGALYNTVECVFTFKSDNNTFFEILDHYANNFKTSVMLMDWYASDNDFDLKHISRVKDTINDKGIFNNKNCFQTKKSNKGVKHINNRDGAKYLALEKSLTFLVLINRTLDKFLFEFLTSEHSKSIVKTNLLYKYIKQLSVDGRKIEEFCKDNEMLKNIKSLWSISASIFSPCKLICSYLARFSSSLEFNDILEMSSTVNTLLSILVTKENINIELYVDTNFDTNNFLIDVRCRQLEQNNLFEAIQNYLSGLKKWCQNAINDSNGNKKNELYLNTLKCDVESFI